MPPISPVSIRPGMPLWRLKDPEILMPRQAEEPSDPSPPVSPDTNFHCSGWTCLTSGQQAGVIVCVTVVFFALAFAVWFFLRSKKKKEEWVDENFVLVRRPRQQKTKPKKSRSNSGYTRPSTPFRHNGLSVMPQAPSLIITPPTFIHLPPPPPPPVPVPVPMPIPMPFPPHQPIPIYPMAYQPHHHGIPVQSVPLQPGRRNQGNAPAPMFPVSGQRQPPEQPQPPLRGQTQNQSWAHHNVHHYPQPVRRPSLARRLFGIFNTPVGRASTIASSDSASMRAQSPRESHRSRVSATSISNPPSLDQRMEKTSEKPPEKQDPTSPAMATVYSDDFIAPSNCPEGLSNQRNQRTAETINNGTVKKGLGLSQRDAGEAKLRGKGKEEARPHSIQETPTNTRQDTVQPREGIHHSPRNIKPGRSVLKKTIRPVEAIRTNGPKAETDAPANFKSFNANNVAPSSLDVEGSPRNSPEQVGQSPHRARTNIIRRQSPYQKAEHDVVYAEAAKVPEKYQPDRMEATLRAVNLLNGYPTTQDNSPGPGFQKESPGKGQCYGAYHAAESEIDEEYCIETPPPSPPRPIHQGGGQYAPDQLRPKRSRRM